MGQDIVSTSWFDRDNFSTCSLSGDDGSIVAIGAPFNRDKDVDVGQVVVYKYDTGTDTWSQLGQSLNGTSYADNFGFDVSLSNNGNRLAVGAKNDDPSGLSNAGKVFVYDYNSSTNTWSLFGQSIYGKASGDGFGVSVSLSGDGNVVASGALGSDPGGMSAAGSVRVFKYNYSTQNWSQLGSDINGEFMNSLSGKAISLSNDGHILAYGDEGADVSGSRSDEGYTRVFEYDDSTDSWTQLGDDIVGENIRDYSGNSVSLSDDGRIVAIGALGVDCFSGHVRVYKYDDNTSAWTQLGDDIVGESTMDTFGQSVSLSGNGHIVAIGAPSSEIESGAYYTYGGQLRVFEYDSNTDTWSQIGSEFYGEQDEQFGRHVSLSKDGHTVAAGGSLYARYVCVYNYQSAELETH